MLHDSKVSLGAFRLDSVVDCSDHGLHLEARTSALAPSQLRSEHARLQTFRNWPPEWGRQLARDGFYSIRGGQSVRCAFCGLEIPCDFSEPRDAIVRHWQSARLYCGFLKGDDVSKESGDAERSAGWPGKSPGAACPQPQSRRPTDACGLAHAGHTVQEKAGRTLALPRLGADPLVTPSTFRKSEPTQAASQQQRVTYPSDTVQAFRCSRSISASPQQRGGSSSWTDIIATARYPHMAAYHTRLDTLATWPLVSPSARQLARAGLFYVRPDHPSRASDLDITWGGDDVIDTLELPSEPASTPCGRRDSVTCFWCGKRMFHWKPTDDALLEHARLSPDCRYVTQLLGRQLHQDVVTTSTREAVGHSSGTDENCPFGRQTAQRGVTSPCDSGPLDRAMHTSAVQAVLGMGFSPQLIRDVLSSALNSQPLSADTLCHLTLQAAARQEAAPSPGIIGEERRRAGRDLNPTLKPASRLGDLTRQQTTQEESGVVRSRRPVPSAPEAERRADGDRAVCWVCSEEEVRVMFRPCNHLVCCARCSAWFTSCPVCQRPVEDTVTTYLA